MNIIQQIEKEQAEAIAAKLDTPLSHANLAKFSNGEDHTRFGESIRLREADRFSVTVWMLLMVDSKRF